MLSDRHKHGWRVIKLKIKLQEIACEDAKEIKMAQGKVQCRVVANTVMKLQFSSKAD